MAGGSHALQEPPLLARSGPARQQLREKEEFPCACGLGQDPGSSPGGIAAGSKMRNAGSLGGLEQDQVCSSAGI